MIRRMYAIRSETGNGPVRSFLFKRNSNEVTP